MFAVLTRLLIASEHFMAGAADLFNAMFVLWLLNGSILQLLTMISKLYCLSDNTDY